MNAYRYVSYVIGMILSFPIRVLHVIPCNNQSNDTGQMPIHNSHNYSLSNKNQSNNYTSQQGVKRNCGQSQQSVRLAHKAKQLRNNK